MTLLNKPKMSARITNEAPSFVNQGILVALANSVFTFANPGPLKVFRPKLPCVPGPGAGKAVAGNTPLMKALRLAEIEFPNDGASAS